MTAATIADPVQRATISRRSFLLSAGAVAVGFGGLYALVRRQSRLEYSAARFTTHGYGALQFDERGILDLPSGFRYTVFSRAGEEMNDGLVVPALHDGMAAFPAQGGMTLLVRNHECDSDDARQGAFGPRLERLHKVRPESFYDFGSGKTPGLGGTTSLLFDTRSQRLVQHQLSLAGTIRNCAGGPTPWGSWLSCEETTIRAEKNLQRDHGYVFEVSADIDAGLAAPIPITTMGRFNHEAVAVDPESGIVYQTEDRSDGLIYRYIPAAPGRLLEGGRLQALAIMDTPRLDVRNWDDSETVIARDQKLPVQWIDVTDIDSPADDLRLRGYAAGAARFARGEGMWYGRGAVYFACTNGGARKLGQIWRYTPSPHEGTPGEAEAPGILELFIEPNDAGLVENADNVTVAPWGDLVICEDGKDAQFLVGVTPEGGLYKLARNRISEYEFAGATFSPDGSTLFVNIQRPGLTLAITGPWKRAASA